MLRSFFVFKCEVKRDSSTCRLNFLLALINTSIIELGKLFVTFKIQTNLFFSIKIATYGGIPKHGCVCYSLPIMQILKVTGLKPYCTCKAIHFSASNLYYCHCNLHFGASIIFCFLLHSNLKSTIVASIIHITDISFIFSH